MLRENFVVIVKTRQCSKTKKNVPVTFKNLYDLIRLTVATNIKNKDTFKVVSG